MDRCIWATPLLFLALTLCACHSPRTAASAHPIGLPREEPATASGPHTASMQGKSVDEVLRGDEAKILVFPECASYPRGDLGAPKVSVDELIELVKDCRVEVVYELARHSFRGTLPDLQRWRDYRRISSPRISAGRHIASFPQAFYWKENNVHFRIRSSRRKSRQDIHHDGSKVISWSSRSDKSAYHYKPVTQGEESAESTAMAASFKAKTWESLCSYFRFAEPKTPPRGSTAGSGDTGVWFGRWEPSYNVGEVKPWTWEKSPLRDVRVVSTVEHDC